MGSCACAFITLLHGYAALQAGTSQLPVCHLLIELDIPRPLHTACLFSFRYATFHTTTTLPHSVLTLDVGPDIHLSLLKEGEGHACAPAHHPHHRTCLHLLPCHTTSTNWVTLWFGSVCQKHSGGSTWAASKTPTARSMQAGRRTGAGGTSPSPAMQALCRSSKQGIHNSDMVDMNDHSLLPRKRTATNITP